MSVCCVYVFNAHVVHVCTGVCNCILSCYLVILFSFFSPPLGVISLLSLIVYVCFSPPLDVCTSEGSGAADGVTPWGTQQTAWPSARRDQWEAEDHRRLNWVSASLLFLTFSDILNQGFLSRSPLLTCVGVDKEKYRGILKQTYQCTKVLKKNSKNAMDKSYYLCLPTLSAVCGLKSEIQLYPDKPCGIAKIM